MKCKFKKDGLTCVYDQKHEGPHILVELTHVPEGLSEEQLNETKDEIAKAFKERNDKQRQN